MTENVGCTPKLQQSRTSHKATPSPKLKLVIIKYTCKQCIVLNRHGSAIDMFTFCSTQIPFMQEQLDKNYILAHTATFV